MTDEPGIEWFVIVSGPASCRVRGRTVASFGPEDFFSELSLIDGGTLSASVDAETEMQLLDLDRHEFRRLLEVALSMAAKLLATMAARLRATDLAISQVA